MRASLLFLLVIGMPGLAAPFPEVRVQVGGEARIGLRVDGRLVAPIFFAANNQWNRDDVLVEGIKTAEQAGVPFYTFNLLLPSYTGEEALRETLERFGTASASGKFLVRVWLGATAEWLSLHGDDRMRCADGRLTEYASLASEAWRRETDAQLRSLLGVIGASAYAQRFLGVHLCYLNTGEWFPPDTENFVDYSAVNESAFARWYREQYPDAAPVGVPAPEEREEAAWGPFRNPARSHGVMAYDRYWSELTVDVIAHFAATVKEATARRALVGAFYGYTFELNHNGPRALANSGHTALGRLLRMKDVDFIAAPYSYFERDAGGPAHFHLPVDSVALHGKLAVMEDDTYTDLAMEPPSHAIAPGWHARAGDRTASLRLVRRNAALFAEHRCGWWMFDLLSDGRWNHADFWDALGPAVSLLAETREFAPRVAFLPNEDAVHLLRASTHPELLQSLGGWRHELGQLKEPVGYFLQSDVGRLPTSVETVILPNPYIVTPEERSAIEAVLDRGGTVVWTYAAGLFDAIPGLGQSLDAGAVLERVGACTGFPVEDAGPGAMTLRLESDGVIHETDPSPWRGRLAIVPGDFQVLARYADGAGIAVARRRAGRGTVVYSAVPRIPNSLFIPAGP